MPALHPAPELVVHADWSTSASKRWYAAAIRSGNAYYIASAAPVGPLHEFWAGLKAMSFKGGVVVGFDFPIGVPQAYAEAAGIQRFLDVLPNLGQGRWADFYQICRAANEICTTRPFYPYKPGGTKVEHLLRGLGIERRDELLRRCERPTENRGAASPLFWTLGAKQVGRAAISGWHELIGPAASDPSTRFWPFQGGLLELAVPGSITVAETYPAEAGLHIGLSAPGRGWSKARREGRLAQAAKILEHASRRGHVLDDGLVNEITEGFGDGASGEDRFDGVVGLLGMLEVVQGCRPDGAPMESAVQNVEGWILGLVA